MRAVCSSGLRPVIRAHARFVEIRSITGRILREECGQQWDEEQYLNENSVIETPFDVSQPATHL
jgi:hypothetical protein